MKKKRKKKVVESGHINKDGNVMFFRTKKRFVQNLKKELNVFLVPQVSVKFRISTSSKF